MNDLQYYLADIAELIPYARNARTHSPEQIAQIAASIKEFGFLAPIVISEDNTILCGHGRFYAAQKLGLAKIPCVKEAHLTEAQKRAYIIADNKLTLNAGWDDELLAVELADLQGEGFDMSLLGFDAELADPLAATDYKDPPLVSTDYIVRRLTPTECARLQGFPDWWCAALGTEKPSDADVEFWTEVFETNRLVLGVSKKSKSRKQIIKWLKAPHSDSAEYKMWGNGVALPCVYYILAAINYTNSSG